MTCLCTLYHILFLSKYLTTITSVHHIQNLSEYLEHFTHFQENFTEIDDIETVVYPLRDKSFIVKDHFAASSDQLQYFRSIILTLNEQGQAFEDVETVIFPIKRKLSLTKGLITKPERYLDNTAGEGNTTLDLQNQIFLIL